jgi:hypothetical protein
MTELLKKAITKLKTMFVSEQDAITTMILEELADDMRWQENREITIDRLFELAVQLNLERS